jgi:hypothetical protein
MDVFTHEEIRIFCKRTKQIELERELRTQLETRTGAIVRAAAKHGEFVDYENSTRRKKPSSRRISRTRQDFKARPWTRIGEASWLRGAGMP